MISGGLLSGQHRGVGLPKMPACTSQAGGISRQAGICRNSRVVNATRSRLFPTTPKPDTGGISGAGGSGGRRFGGRGPWWRSGDDEDEDERSSSRRDISADSTAGSLQWKGWQERVDADPNFKDKVLIEQGIGVAASVIGDMASRPNWGIYELDFVFSTLIVGSILNFSLMYLLAPTTATLAGGAAAGGFVSKLFGDTFLRRWGAPTGHLFESGFPLSKRLVNFGYKGVIFGVIGLGAGIVGTSMSNGLLLLRKKLDPNFHTQNKPPSVWLNASTWSLHMGLSSNLRYQALNGFDMVTGKRLSPGTFRLLTAVLRTANNVLGGLSFVTLARLTGVQAAADPGKLLEERAA